MEQSTLTLEQARWASAIAKLTSLTYEGKLQWVRVDTGAANSASAFSSSLVSSRYEAELTKQKFILTISQPSSGASNSWSDPLGTSVLPTFRTKVNFRAFDQQRRKVIEMTDLSILNTLANAVEAESASRESSVLAAIENA